METKPEIFLSNSERSKVSKLGVCCVCSMDEEFGKGFMEEEFGKEWIENDVGDRTIIFAKRTKLVNTIMTSKI